MAHHCLETAPWPVFWRGDHPRPDRIEYNIARQFQQIRITVNEDGLVGALEQVLDSLMAPIGALGIDAIEVPHALRQISIRRFDQKMIMVAHQAIGVAVPIPSLSDLIQDREKRLAIVLIFVDGLLSVAPRGDMVEGARKFDA